MTFADDSLGVTSGHQALASQGQSVTIARSDGDTFDFDAAMLTLLGANSSQVTIAGFLDGEVVGLETMTLMAGRTIGISPQDDLFDHVDQIVFTAADGLRLDDLNFIG